MRLAAALSLFTGLASAQVTIPPHAATYNGFSRGFSFVAQTNCFITGLDLPPDAFQVGDTAGYLVRINGQVALRSVGNAGPIQTNVAIAHGDAVDVIGNWSSAVPGVFTAHNSYGSATVGGGAAPFATALLGIPHTLYRTGWQDDIADPAWTNANGFVTPTAGQIGRVFVYVSGSAGAVTASNTAIGAGCGGPRCNSFYQRFATASAAAAALSGHALVLTPTATGYHGTFAVGAAASLYVPPGAAATVLATGDDGVVSFTTSAPLMTPFGSYVTFQVSGNGIVALGSGTLDYPGTMAHLPTVTGFLDSTLGGFYSWHDFNTDEVGSGAIRAQEIGGTLYITWQGVESYAVPETMNPSTLQFQFELASGRVRMVWLGLDGNSSSAYGSAHLIGITAPGTSHDPGAIVLASATGLDTFTPEQTPLALVPVTRPLIGTTWSLATQNVPTSSVFGLEVLGLGDPGINDLASIGMPGCGQRASLDNLNVFLVTGPSHAWSYPIPNAAALLNLHVYASTSVMQPGINPFGWITSNGIDARIGNQ